MGTYGPSMSELRKIPWWAAPIVIAVLLLVLVSIANFTGEWDVYKPTKAAIDTLNSWSEIIDNLKWYLLILVLICGAIFWPRKKEGRYD